MTGPKPSRRVPRQKKPRRVNPGRRRGPETDVPQPMNEDELMACIVLAEELSSKLLQQGNVANARRILAALLRLVAEVRRLRVEIKEAKAAHR